MNNHHASHGDVPATYIEFVQQSRRVLGLPERTPPRRRINPELHSLMQEAVAKLNKHTPLKESFKTFD